MLTREMHVRQFVDGQPKRPTTDTLCLEVPLHIVLNGEPFSVTLRTPGDDLSLVRGFFHSEGIAKHLPGDAIQQSAKDRIEITIPEPFACPEQAVKRRLASNTSCGLCGNVTLLEPDTSVAPIPVEGRPDPAAVAPRLDDLFERLWDQQLVFQDTGGCHGAGVFDAEDNWLAVAEDIGRHNAVDKVIGQLLDEGSLERAQILLVSGRVSYEIVAKCWRAGIPVLAAVSAPSSLAVELAGRLGLTLFGFCREGTATLYT